MNAAVIDHPRSHLAHLAGITAGLRYLEPTTEKPRSLEFEPPPGVAQSTAVWNEHLIEIRDMRPASASISLEREGFRLLTAPTRIRDFGNEDDIRTGYYAEAISLLKRITGGSRVVVFDHTVRRRIPGATDRTSGIPRQPVPRAHNDYTLKSGPQRVRDLLGEEAEDLLQRRFSIVNVWRPLNGPVQDSPLAVCDARSVEDGDLVATDLVYPDRVGEIYYVKFNSRHRWFYAPAMRNDEVMLIKCYDSEDDGRARFVPHAAFVDPNTPAGARARESIELRTLVFYPR